MNPNEKRQKLFRNLFLLNFTSNTFVFNNILASGTLFMTSFALYLGANDAELGLLASIPSLTNVFQIFSIYLFIRFRSRKKIILSLLVFQYVFFYFMLIIPRIATGKYQIYLLASCIFMIFLGKTMASGGLIEWNNFFVSPTKAGQYYSTRNLISNAVYILSSLIIGKLLDLYGGQYTGYLIIFLLTVVFAVFEIASLLKIEDYNSDLLDKSFLPFRELFSIPFRNHIYMKYVIFTIAWGFGVSLSMPYYTVYAVKYLGFNYSYIALIGSITCFIKIFIAKIWGAAGDRKGWRNIVLAAGIGYALTNMTWFAINSTTTFLYPFNRISNGIFMIGINVAIFNLNITLSDSENRLVYFGFNTALVGIFSFISPNVSSAIVRLLARYDMSFQGFKINGYQVVFLLSSIILLFAALIYYKTGLSKPVLTETSVSENV